MNNFIKYKFWYKITSDKLKVKYREDFFLICGLIAAISPQTPVKRNLLIAELILKDFKTNKEKFLKLIKNKTRFFKKYGLFKPHYKNILKVLTHDFKTDLKLNGNKVFNFYLNLTGNYEAVTIDSWMLRYFKHPESRVNHLNKSEYYFYADKIKKEARELGLLPAEYQAILWTKTRQEAGQEPACFSDYL